MTFAIEVQTQRWREHCQRVMDEYRAAGAEVIPVIKSNGYGLGQTLLAKEASRLGAKTIAVGTVFEAREALSAFAGDVVVLEPYLPADESSMSEWQALQDEDRLIATVASSDAAAAIASTRRVMIELVTGMQRFGFPDLDSMPMLRVEGITLHLPFGAPGVKLDEVAKRCGKTLRLSVSHVSAQTTRELAAVAPVSVRAGTRLWLGDRGALRACGTVLEVRTASRAPIGYHASSTHRGQRYAVVAGGTAHGIGLEAPVGKSSLRQRAVAVAKGLLDASGRLRSPFQYEGNKLEFVETPHQQVSMVWLPKSARVEVGDSLTADVRYTITRADVVRGLD